MGSQIKQPNEYFVLDAVEYGWIASIVNVGCIIGCLSIGYMMDKIGRKWTILVMLIPVTIGWILIIFSQNFAMMLIGRLLTGLSGAFTVSGPQYTSEMAEKEIRGALAIMSQVFFMAGIVFAYSVGAGLNIFGLSVVSFSNRNRGLSAD